MTDTHTPADRSTDAARFESLGRLTPGIAHEINTPIQYLGDNAHFLHGAWADLGPLFDALTKIRDRAGEGALSAADAAEIIEAMRTADLDYLRQEVPIAIDRSIEGARRVGDIVRAMKEFAQDDETGKTSFDLNQVVGQTIAIARNELKYVADVTTDFDAQAPQAFGFPGQISLVLLDLLISAAQAITAVQDGGLEDKGRIVVRTLAFEDAVEIRVEDTAQGIPEDIRAQDFERSFSTETGSRNRGRGLASARRLIVDGHAGSLSLATEPGKGTTFIVRLPLTIR